MKTKDTTLSLNLVDLSPLSRVVDLIGGGKGTCGYSSCGCTSGGSCGSSKCGCPPVIVIAE